MLRMVNQAKLRTYNHAPKYKFGFLIPKDCEQVVKSDAKNASINILGNFFAMTLFYILDNLDVVGLSQNLAF